MRCIKATKKIFFAVYNKDSNSRTQSRREACISSRRKPCISSTRSVEYHQAADRCTLKRDEIQGRIAPLMIYAALRAPMICQACGNPQSSASSLRGTPTAAWIKKFDKSKLVEFFVKRLRKRYFCVL